MDLLFKNSRLRKSCTDKKTLVKVHGPERAKILRRRLDQLHAATNLAMMKVLPGKCHEMVGDRRGALAVALDGPYRLLFEPAENPPPQLEKGGLDWNAVTAVRVLEVENYHE